MVGDAVGFDPLACDALATCDGLFGVDDADGLGHVGVGGEVFGVPALDDSAGLLPGDRRDESEDAFGVREECRVVVFERGENVLFVVETEVEEGGFEVDGIARDCVDEAAVVAQDALEEPLGGRDLAFLSASQAGAGTEHLHVERESEVVVDQRADHAHVVILRYLLALHDAYTGTHASHNTAPSEPGCHARTTDRATASPAATEPAAPAAKENHGDAQAHPP